MRIRLLIFLSYFFLLSTSLSAQDQSDEERFTECQEYWRQQYELRKNNANYFKNNILEPALQNDMVPKMNKYFLQKLYDYLALGWIAKASIPTISKPIFPIFILKENQLGVFAFPKYNCYQSNGSTVCDILPPEWQEILKGREKLKYPFEDPDPNLISFNESFDALVENENIFVYTRDSKYRDKIIEFSFYRNENRAIEFYHYLLKKQEKRQALIGSPYSFELEYINLPEIDKQIESQHRGECHDCYGDFEKVTSYAVLKGVPGLYFTYTDTFPLNNKLKGPARAIYMELEDGTLISLWGESLDLFGCSI